MTKADQSGLLRETPLLGTHDAATGFMGSSSWMCTAPGVAPQSFAKTQNIKLVDHLNCGARVLDLRLNKCHGWLWAPIPSIIGHSGPGLGYKDKKMRFAHGDVIFDQQPKDEVPKLVEWAIDHPEELVVLYFQTCKNLKCTDSELLDVLADNGVWVVNPTGTEKVQDLTTDYVKNMAKVTSDVASKGRHYHGMVAVLTDGVEDNYDKDARWYHNADDPAEKSWPIWNAYRDLTLERHSTTTLWQLQHFWQQDQATSVHSTIPSDHGMLRQLYTDIESGMYDSRINIVTVNWMCEGGFDVADRMSRMPGAITTISQADKDQCRAACGSHYTPLANIK